MDTGLFNILILCSSNSTLSIMAEALFNTMGRHVFHAYSGGICPAGELHACTRDQVAKIGYPQNELSSKSWKEFFLTPPAPVMDFIITMGKDVEFISHPKWPGHPFIAHWQFDDPAYCGEANQQRIFDKSFKHIMNRVQSFAALPLPKLARMTIQQLPNMEAECAAIDLNDGNLQRQPSFFPH